jgi:hypothetical protein
LPRQIDVVLQVPDGVVETCDQFRWAALRRQFGDFGAVVQSGQLWLAIFIYRPG